MERDLSALCSPTALCVSVILQCRQHGLASPALCHLSQLLTVSLSAANTRTDLAGETEAVEMLLAAEVDSCHPVHSSSCCTVWVCCHLECSEGSFSAVPCPAAIWAVLSPPIYSLLTEQ